MANRRNGRRGGPKTAEGKAVSRLNARKHGVLTTLPVDEDLAELREIYEGFAEDARPVGAGEEFLIGELARVSPGPAALCEGRGRALPALGRERHPVQ